VNTSVNLYSSKKGEIKKFLGDFYNESTFDNNILKWEKDFSNPIEMADMIGVFIDNNDRFSINMWISLDDGFFININDNNVNKIIKYLYERYPY
jgi:lipopolysaccharide biosynthesis protein